MNRLILADNQAIFRAGAARVLALEDDMRIVAQCEDGERCLAAIDTLRGIGAAGSRQPAAGSQRRCCPRPGRWEAASFSWPRTASRLERSLAASSMVFCRRNVSGNVLVDCVRRVAQGQRFVQRSNVTTMQAADSVGSRVRDRLTPKEMQIVALIVQGCKNKEIAMQLGTKEQVIKNYLRSIYDKTGVSDRLELALFTIHHRALAEAAAKAGNLIQMKTA